MAIRVLWVEDEPESLSYQRIWATQQGWCIADADNAQDALEKIREESFRVVVLDLILSESRYAKERGYVNPDVGVNLMRSIRDLPEDNCTPPNVKLLVISAVVTPNRRAAVFEHLTAEEDYLMKPVDKDKYHETVIRINKELDVSDHNKAEDGEQQ